MARIKVTRQNIPPAVHAALNEAIRLMQQSVTASDDWNTAVLETGKGDDAAWERMRRAYHRKVAVHNRYHKAVELQHAVMAAHGVADDWTMEVEQVAA